MFKNWRDQLDELEGFPLLPCGAGDKRKAPIDPVTARPLRDWQNSAFTPKQIKSMSDAVVCVGTRTGIEAGNLLFVDIDGQSALDYCTKSECRISDSGWIIGRDTDHNRLKVVFRIKDPKLSSILSRCGKIVLPTSSSPREQLEFFYGRGQCIVLGQHCQSGGNYVWTGQPQNINIPSLAWQKLIEKVATTRKQLPLALENEAGWDDCIPCPICDRTELDCRIHQYGQFIQCHKGSRWHPPDLLLGQTVTRNGVIWAYVGDSENAIGPCSNFKTNEKKKLNSNQTICRESTSLVDLDIRPARGGGADVGKVDWVIEGFAAIGIVLLAAEPGTGKTTLLYRAADSIQEGTSFLGSVPVTQGSVLVVQGDEPEYIARQKMSRMDLKANFDILYGDQSLEFNALSEVILSKRWRVLIIDSLTTVLASLKCTTLDFGMTDQLYKLNKLASDNNILILMTAHLTKPSKDGSGARMKRKIIEWADISGIGTISGAINDAWGLTPKEKLFSLHALGKRHVERGTEWILERYGEDFSWELKQVTDSLMPQQMADTKSKISIFLKDRVGKFFTVKEISLDLHLNNEEYARRCLCHLYDSKVILRRKRPENIGRPSYEYGLNI